MFWIARGSLAHRAWFTWRQTTTVREWLLRYVE